MMLNEPHWIPAYFQLLSLTSKLSQIGYSILHSPVKIISKDCICLTKSHNEHRNCYCILFLLLICAGCNNKLLFKKSDHLILIYSNHPVSNSKIIKHKKQFCFQVILPSSVAGWCSLLRLLEHKHSYLAYAFHSNAKELKPSARCQHWAKEQASELLLLCHWFFSQPPLQGLPTIILRAKPTHSLSHHDISLSWAIIIIPRRCH